MLKGKLKRVLSVALAVAVVATSSVTVSAATIKPKKKHTKAQITKMVNWHSKAYKKYAFMKGKDSWVPVTLDQCQNFRLASSKDNTAYSFYMMTTLLSKTPGITSAQKKQMQAASRQWKKAVISGKMWGYYVTQWTTVKNSVNENNAASKAKKAYNNVKKYCTKYKAYNPTLSKNLISWSKKYYSSWKNAAATYKKLSKAQREKLCYISDGYGRKIVSLGSCMKGSVYKCFQKNKLGVDPASFGCIDGKYADKALQYSWHTLNMSPCMSGSAAFGTIVRENGYLNWEQW